MAFAADIATKQKIAAIAIRFNISIAPRRRDGAGITEGSYRFILWVKDVRRSLRGHPPLSYLLLTNEFNII
jgi:hypothetical protein